MSDSKETVLEIERRVAASAATQAAFEDAWKVVSGSGGAIVREVDAGRVHLRTRDGMQVLFERSHAPALRAVLALLEAR
jgi:hypothetical protein